MKQLKGRFLILLNYRHLLQQLVEKDVKLKYRRSFLGYLWSILNPLLTMSIMVLVFSNMFRFDIDNFPVYLIIGQSLFNFLTESTTQSIYSITGNAALLKKTYVPKYVFTISRITSSLVNLLFALGAMLIVFIICEIEPTVCFLFIPIIFIEIYIFCLGLGMFLSQAAVFFRDIQYIYNAIVTAWMYLTPLFYPIEALPIYLQNGIKSFNPMYNYVTQFRMVVMQQVLPPSNMIISGFIVAFVVLFLGTWTFLKTQDKFILYI